LRLLVAGLIVNRRAIGPTDTPRHRLDFKITRKGPSAFRRSPAAPPFCFNESVNLAMTDQEFALSALRQVGLIIAEHLELGVTDADETITQLVKVLDTKELADAINRLEQGYGLRVVK
jgi:hypothetical protein